MFEIIFGLAFFKPFKVLETAETTPREALVEYLSGGEEGGDSYPRLTLGVQTPDGNGEIILLITPDSAAVGGVLRF